MVDTAGSVEVLVSGNIAPLSRSLRAGEAATRSSAQRMQRGFGAAGQSVGRTREQIDRARASTDALGASATRTSGAIRGMAAIIAVGAYGMVRFAQGAVQTASEMEELGNLLQVTFREGTGAVRAWADETSASMQRSRLQMLKFAGDFATFLKPLGTAPDQIRPMAQALAELTFDIASFRNLSDQDVFTKLFSGLAGETEAVRRLGIDLGQAAIEAELLRMGINKTSAEASQGEKVMARFAIIMRQTTDAQGDAIRTAGSFENQTKALSAAMEDLRLELGMALQPTAFAGLQTAITITRSLTDNLDKVAAGVAGVAAAVTTLLIPAIVRLGAAILLLARNPLVIVAAAAAVAAGSLVLLREEVEKLIGLGNSDFSNFTTNLLPGASPILPGGLTPPEPGTEPPPPAVDKDAAKALKQFNDAIQAVEKETEALHLQADALGMSAAAAAEYTKKQELLNLARRSGIQLSEKDLENIDRVAAAYGKATAELERMNAAAEAQQFLAQSLLDAVRGADSLADAFKRLAASILEAAAQALILGSGPLAGLLGTAASGRSGGLLGTLLGAIIPGIGHAGGRAGALPSSGRAVPALAFAGAPRLHSGRFFKSNEMPAILDKREEVGFPSQLAARYGQQSRVLVQVEASEYFDVRVQEVSGSVAARTTSSGITTQKKLEARAARLNQ